MTLKKEHAEDLWSAALMWWKHHRPCAYTVLQHLHDPLVGLYSTSERALGSIVAEILREQDLEEKQTEPSPPPTNDSTPIPPTERN